jgi:hypothetical protein
MQGRLKAKRTSRTTTYPASKDNGGQQHVVEAEDERRHVSHRSASPVRTVRLGLSNLTFPHDELNIHHTMQKSDDARIRIFGIQMRNAFSSEWAGNEPDREQKGT